MKEQLYKISPHFLQNLFITLYNIKAYKSRHGGRYKKYLKNFKANRNLSLAELKSIHNNRFLALLHHAQQHSAFYSALYKNIEMPQSVEDISKLPIVDKEMLRKNIDKVHTINSKHAIHSKTGGTTGKSLEVYFTHENMQERFAMLDDFRGRYGYALGKKTAWFSGKALLTNKDIRRNRFWKTDWYHKVRYYSTFHIKDEYIKYSVKDLMKFQPEYISGFPSTIFEIAKYGKENEHVFTRDIIKAIFVTGVTITSEMRKTIESFFHAKMYNQYASSEGAPFIFECSEGNLHLELQSGVFEVLDSNNKPSNSGRLVITSFTTDGTPLIRYDIGDSITLEDKNSICPCGNNNPLVRDILGRMDDFVYSPENGKINIINIANAIKDVKGIIRHQIIQDEINSLLFKIIVDNTVYGAKEEKRFIQNWRDRVGDKMDIKMSYVDDIPVEKSGKFRIVKNNIKHLLND